MLPFIYVTGMFRSGTTLLARMLNAHPEITCASDPYQPIFKEFRNLTAEKLFGKENVDRNAPFEDYYFYPDSQALFNGIQDASLECETGQLDLTKLQKTVVDYAHDFSPRISNHISELKGESFTELITAGLNIIHKAYGDEQTKILGFKTTWAGEYGRHILAAFDGAKVIHIVRDPRAICASKFSRTNATYPLLFLIRHWRKLATIAWLDSRPDYENEDRVLVIQYEKLVKDPEDQARRICNFLDINFHPNLIDARTYKNGEGQQWEQNTSYNERKTAITTSSVEKWKKVFDERQIEFIERLSLGEMLLFGYTPHIADSSIIPAEMVFDPPEVPKEQLAEWIIPYTRLDRYSLLHDMALEAMRGFTLQADSEITKSIKCSLALAPQAFDEICLLLNKMAASQTVKSAE